MRSFYIVFFCGLVGLAACNDNKTGENKTTGANTTAPAPKEAAHSKLSDEGTNMLMGVLNKYYALKNALVATKADDANNAALQLAANADSLQAYLQKDSVNSPALRPYLDTIITQGKVLGAINDKSCEQQRMSFELISRAFYGLLKSSDIRNAHVYHQFCPMAFNDKGAFWLSDESEIKNPYFGKKMLECGETTDSL